jgi:hypothetical protein
MIWFNNDGGPLLVAAVTGLDAWEGADPPSGGRLIDVDSQVDPDGLATDYDRACGVMLPAGAVTISQGWGAVVSAEGSAAWLEPDVIATTFVEEDSSPEKLRELLVAMPESEWISVVPSMTIDDRGVVLLHAASTIGAVRVRDRAERGDAAIGDAILSRISAGRYCVEYASLKSDTEWDVGFLRLRRLSDVAA